MLLHDLSLSGAEMCQRLVISDLLSMDHQASLYTVAAITLVQTLLTICGLMMTLLMQFVLKMLSMAKLQQKSIAVRVAPCLYMTMGASCTRRVQYPASLPRKLPHHDKLDRKSKTCKRIWEYWLVPQAELSSAQLQERHEI